jgi:hypothetical protein
MNKSMLMKSFNQLFFEFLDDIITIYPENKEIRIGKEKFELIRRGNPTILIKFWKNYVYDRYREQIEAGDIHFFIQKDYKSDLANSIDVGFSNDKVLSMIENIRETIRDMDEANLKHSSVYILNLSQLSEMYSTATA